MTADAAVGRSSRSAPLRHWQRLDWRFLLPDGAAAPVVFAGGDVELAEALQETDAGCRAVTDAAGWATVGKAATVVLSDPTLEDLEAAVAACRPGGWVYAEVRPRTRRRPGEPRSLAGWARAFRRAGLEPVRLHWHVRDLSNGTRILPLASTAAVRRLLGGHEGSRSGRLRAAVARVLLETGLLPHLVPEGSVLGQAPGGHGETSLLERLAIAGAPEIAAAAAGGLEAALVTPKEPTSRSVVGFLHPAGDGRPLAVVKAARRPEDRIGVEREAEGLRALSAVVPAGRAPRVLGVGRVGGAVALVQTVVSGRPLNPAAVRAAPEDAVRLGVEFVDGLPEVRSAQENVEWYVRTVEAPLDRLAGAAPLEGATAALVRRTHAVLAPLRSVSLPAVLEHADLAYPNLLVDPVEEGLGVIDWERSSTDGLPGHDLVFFLQFVAEALTRADRPERWRAAFDSAFVGPEATATPVLDAHLARFAIGAELRPLLVVASWARSAAGLAARLVPDDGAASPDIGEDVRGAREFVLWAHAVAVAERAADASHVDEEESSDA